MLSSWSNELMSQDELVEDIRHWCMQPTVGGLTLELPLSAKYNREKVLNFIHKSKDVNCLNSCAEAIMPPAVAAVKKIIKDIKYNLKDKTAAVVGYGILIGKPIAAWLGDKVKNLLVFDSKSDLCLLAKADLIITGVGKKGLIKPEMLKDSAGVIDFGFGGDFDASGEDVNKLSFYTPTPGGTGPILTACLFENFYKLNTA